jgi:hypothetical protein
MKEAKQIGENDKITIFFYKICGAVPIRTAPLFYYPFSFFKFSYTPCSTR